MIHYVVCVGGLAFPMYTLTGRKCRYATNIKITQYDTGSHSIIYTISDVHSGEIQHGDGHVTILFQVRKISSLEHDVFPQNEVSYGASLILLPIYWVKSLKNNFGARIGVHRLFAPLTDCPMDVSPHVLTFRPMVVSPHGRFTLH